MFFIIVTQKNMLLKYFRLFDQTKEKKQKKAEEAAKIKEQGKKDIQDLKSIK